MATSPYFSTSNQYILYDIHVDELSTSIANNTSTVRVWVIAWRTNQGYTTQGSGYCYCSIDGQWIAQEIDSSQVIGYESDTIIFDKTLTISHNADGTKNIFVEAKIDHSRVTSDYNGFTVSLTAIPRQANLTAVQNFNDEQNPVITYSNPAGVAVDSLQACISLNGSADIAYRDVSKTGTSYTFNLTTAERNVLRSSIPNSNSRTITFYLKTVIGGNTYYSTKTATFSIVNALPAISGQAYRDSNSAIVAITGNNQKIVQNQSQLLFTFSSLVAYKYASLVRLEITINSVKKTLNLSGTSASNASLTFGVLDTSSDATASIVLIDSRGNSKSISMNISVYDWKAPTAICKANRQSNYYNPTTVFCDASFASLGGNNTISITWFYKEKSASSYTSGGTLSDGGSAVVNLDNKKAWDVRFVVADRIATTTYNLTVPTGIPIWFIDRVTRSIGIGTFPDEVNQLAVDRRMSLKNLAHENVLDLWSKSPSETFRSASMYVYDHNQNVLSRITAFEYGSTGKGYGDLRAFDSDGKSLGAITTTLDGLGGWIGVYSTSSNSARASMATNSNGGRLWIGTNDGNNGIVLENNSQGGIFGLYSNSPSLRVIYGDVYNGGGRFWILNSSNQATITNSGHSGNITCVSLTQTSSRKVKENIEELSVDEALKILQLVAVSFDFINHEQGTDQRGFIAEDVAEIIPELVIPETDEQPASLNYLEMIPYMQTVIKNQEKRIADQEKRITELEARLEALEKKLSQ